MAETASDQSKETKKTPDKKSNGSVKSATKPTAQTSPKRSNRDGLLKAMLWIGVIFVIAGLSWFSHQENPTDIEGARQPSDQLIQQLQDGDCSGMYASATEGFKSQSTEENWNTQCGVASDVLQGEPEAVSTQNDNTEDDSVQFVYSIAGTDDQTYSVLTVMKLVDNQWLMDGLSSQISRTDTNPTE